MRKLIAPAIALLTITIAAAAPAPAPVVLRQSLWVRTATMHEDDWVPSIAFLLKGDLPVGSELAAEYTKPDGALWGRVALRAGSPDGRGVRSVGQTMLDPDLSIKDGGVFKVAIELSGEGGKGKQTLFTGQFRVEKLPPPNAYKKPAFAVDHDWVLPVAQLYFDPQRSDNPSLFVTAWFKRHDVSCQDVDATLVYGGKVLASTETSDQGDKAMAESLRSTDDRDDRRYVQCRFELTKIKGYVNGQYQDQASWHELSKFPGEYELKIARQRKLDRTLKFSVDKSGMLVRSGAVEHGYRGLRMLVPTNILGDGDGEWRREAFAKEAFYGNPEGSKAAEATVLDLYADWAKRPTKKN